MQLGNALANNPNSMIAAPRVALAAILVSSSGVPDFIVGRMVAAEPV